MIFGLRLVRCIKPAAGRRLNKNGFLGCARNDEGVVLGMTGGCAVVTVYLVKILLSVPAISLFIFAL